MNGQNQCASCTYKDYPPRGGGWCHMFKLEPYGICGQHKLRQAYTASSNPIYKSVVEDWMGRKL